MKILSKFSGKDFILAKLAILLIALVLHGQAYADAVDDATAADIASLCNNSPANDLFNIANKNSNTQAVRRAALERMMEVSMECAGASEQRLSQYHQKMINAAHKVLGLSEIESRRVAVECFQYVIMQPDNVQPPSGSINRGQTMSNLALNDTDVNIRLWALEALVTLRGDHPTVQSTLVSAMSDPEPIVQQTATDMLAELFP